MEIPEFSPLAAQVFQAYQTAGRHILHPHKEGDSRAAEVKQRMRELCERLIALLAKLEEGHNKEELWTEFGQLKKELLALCADRSIAISSVEHSRS
ncbi:hypothetical protein ACIPLR_17565 [Herbaspirillum huttiense]|uniref:hypothetical protein n=1 Tax=Herbaspirillum huttiense TaxID=863372 RepID=UPI003830732D